MLPRQFPLGVVYDLYFQLFYMVKGDMCLKVVEQGKHRDVSIKEGEVLALFYYILNVSPLKSNL